MSQQALSQETNDLQEITEMPRPKKRVTVSIDAEIMDWVEKEIEDNPIKYRSRSQLFDLALAFFQISSVLFD